MKYYSGKKPDDKRIYDEHGTYICEARSVEKAKEICRILNSHDALVAACEYAAEHFEMLTKKRGVEHGNPKELRAALVLAKKEKP